MVAEEMLAIYPGKPDRSNCLRAKNSLRLKPACSSEVISRCQIAGRVELAISPKTSGRTGTGRHNNASIPCTSSSGVTLPIINRTVQTTLAGVAAKTYTTYNNYALPQVVDEYNYLLAFVRETMTCYASLTNTYIQNRPSSVVVYVSVRWTQETYCDGFHS